MKKSLAKNINRYDSRMLLKFDKRTAAAIGISLAAAAVIWLLIRGFLSMLVAMGTALIAGIAVFIVQIVEYEGMTLAGYFFTIIKRSITGADRQQYEYDADDVTERLIINNERSDDPVEKNSAEKGTRKKTGQPERKKKVGSKRNTIR